MTTWRQKFPHIPAPSRFPSALRFSQTPRVNPAGQCCPHRDTYMLAWQTLPPGGLGINKALSNFWISVPPEGVNHGSSSKSTRDRLTKSSRLADFCSSSDSFYGLNSSVGLSCACTVSTILLISASLDHPLAHCCPPNSLSLSLFPFNILLFPLCSFHVSETLTACCGTEIDRDWRCLSPRGWPGPTSGQESGSQGGAVPAWPHTKHMSSSSENKEHHQSQRNIYNQSIIS